MADQQMREPAVLVDVDGTLAHRRDRGPFEWDKVADDSPDIAVVSVVQSMKRSGWAVLVISGRPSNCWSQTATWLDQHVGTTNWDGLFMRTEGDYRPDSEVKWELFETYIAHRFDLLGVFDDRWSVCQMWLSEGFKVFNVSGLDRGEF